MWRRLVAGLLLSVLLSGVARAEAIIVPMPIPWKTIEAIQERAGFVAVPMSNSVIAESVKLHHLSSDEVFSSDYEYFVYHGQLNDDAGQPVYFLRAVIQTDKKKGDGGDGSGGDDKSWIRKIIVWVVEAVKDHYKPIVGSAIAGCVATVVTDPSCFDVIARQFDDGRLLKPLSRFASIGIEASELYFHQQRALRDSSKYTLVVLEPNSTDGLTYNIWGEQTLELDVAPQIMPDVGRLVVPLRVVEYAGLSVKWDGSTKTATITRPSDGRWAKYTIGETTAQTSTGVPLYFDVAPVIVDDRTMIGLRSALSPFCDVIWQGANRRVLISCVR